MSKSCHHCGQFRQSPLTRRQMLRDSACGFGAVALSALLSTQAFVDKLPENKTIASSGPWSPRPTHFRPKVKHVIYLYMDGGPSQVDTFDPKPLLEREHGKPYQQKIEPTQFNNIGTVMKSPWKFRKYGECGTEVSDLFPYVAQHVDDMAIVRSMVSNFSEHTNANYFLHTGNGFQGRPGMGAWVGYGLGSENQDLPGFVVLNGGLIPPGGLDCFNSGFLPAAFQGSVFNASDPPLDNIRPIDANPLLQTNKLNLIRSFDEATLSRWGKFDELESAISNYELAFRMQTEVPDLTALAGETEATREMYGMNAKHSGTATFGRQCLLARRLVERGVRFIELTCPSIGHDRWDQHGNLRQGHEDNARAVDQGIGALLADLKRVGLFDETLVIWSGEFGRTPFAQGSDGRDHNPFGFSLWMAGGGIKGGTVYGATDEFGYRSVENKVEIHDLHATMLHLLGIDHEQQTYRWGGRDMRLTDVHGKIVHGILA